MNIGDVFGDLQIIDILDYHVEPSGHRRRKVQVRCNCGFEYNTIYNNLQRGAKSCRKCSYFKIRLFKIGEKVDKLTICGYVKTENNRPMLSCRCDCGTENYLVRPTSVKNNKTNNCGCITTAKKYGPISKTFFNRIKRSALVRNIDFSLTHEYLWELFKKQNEKCALSGIKIGFGKLTAHVNTASLDRIDSDKGYTTDNVWWVHKDINLIKMHFPLKYFLHLCKLVTENDK